MMMERKKQENKKEESRKKCESKEKSGFHLT